MVTMEACGTSKEGSSSCFRDPSEMRPATVKIMVKSPTTERLASEAVESLNKDVP